MIVHDFQENNDYSLLDELCESIYPKIWKNIKKITEVKDRSWQLKGVDKVIELDTGKKICIDEKKRRKKYNDIAVEVWSNTEKQTPGWVFKPFTDYVLYVFEDTREAYLFPLLPLRIHIERNMPRLKTLYKEIVADNEWFTTTSYAIPMELIPGITKFV